jgi:hypothetical protein
MLQLEPFFISPGARAILAANAGGRASGVTRDGRLSCRCDPRSGCTCMAITAKRITRDAMAEDLVSAVRRTDAHPILLTAAMCLQHMNQRCDALESRLNGANGGDIDQRFLEAEAKRVELLKQKHIDKIEQAAQQHEADKQPPHDALGSGEAEEQPEDNLSAEQKPLIEPGNELAKYGEFDESVGAQSQATTAHPLGGNSKEEVDVTPVKPGRIKVKDAHSIAVDRLILEGQRNYFSIASA